MGWMTHSLHQIGESLPLAVHRAMVKRDFIVINYHMVSDQHLPHVAHLFPYKTPEMFERDLIYLQHNFNLVSYEQLVEHISGTKKLPSKAAALTFDDGFSECYEIVRPLLKKYNTPCIFFVNTDYIDNRAIADTQKISLCIDQILKKDEKEIYAINQALRESFEYPLDGKQELIKLLNSTGSEKQMITERIGGLLNLNFAEYLADQTPYLNSAQIQLLNREGFTIGSHGKKHVKFSMLTSSQVEEAMADSCFTISQLTGKQSVPFAFPHTADGVPRDLLQKVLTDYPHVGLLFDTNGIRKEVKFLISRLNGDRHNQREEKRSNLSLNIKKAYIEEIARGWRRSSNTPESL